MDRPATSQQQAGSTNPDQVASILEGLGLHASTSSGASGEALNISYEINKILDCGLDKETLSICIALLENGVNPEALAEVVKRLRQRAAQAAQQQQAQQQQQQGQAP